MYDSNEIIVISVGGSLICPDRIDVDFLKGFKKLILAQIKKNKRFIIITGGGRTARNYQEAARSVGELTSEDVDWLGIHGTRINAHLMRAIFYKYAHPDIVKDPTQKVSFNEKILVAGGWKPGCSTDYDAVMLAKQFGVEKIINLSNIDYVYDKDPSKFPDAKPFKEMSWKDFRKKFGSKWNPGLNSPFDPVASKEAEKLKLAVFVANGSDMDNLDKIISGESQVKATIIT
jgi:uridylate kinase